mgnify:CR=1 FL=1
MTIFQFLQNLATSGPTKDLQATSESVCPNCWGRSEYDGQFYEAVKNNIVDINSSDPKIGWIQAYTNKYLVSNEDDPQSQKYKVSYKSFQ